MSEPFQPVSKLSFFLSLLRGLLFFNMGPIVIAALGAGAFVTTAAAGVILLRRKVLSRAVEVDVEKGPEENVMERREGTGPGWKEFTEVDEKGTYELLVPLVGAFHSQQETDVTDADRSRTPLSPKPQFATLHQFPDPPTTYVQQQVDPVPMLEGDISDTHEQDHAPAFPPGLPVPAEPVAVATPISVRLNRLSGLSPLDTGGTITSWPVLAPTPIEELRTKANGQGEQAKSDIRDDVVPQDEQPASSPKARNPEIIPIDPIVPSPSEVVQESDEVDPFADPPDSLHSPLSQVSPEEEVSLSCRPRSSASSLNDPNPTLSAGWPCLIDPVSAPSVLCANSSVVMIDTVFPANIPLPESPLMPPKAVSPLLIRTLPLDTVVTATVIFGAELSPGVEASDMEPSSPAIEASFVPILVPIVTTCLEDTNDVLQSPFSDTSSSYSSSDSSGPDTPTGLKQDLPFSPVLDFSSKATPGLQYSVCLPSEEDAIIDEDVEYSVCLPSEEDAIIDEDVEVIDDFVMVEQQAPDPASPTIDTVSPDWTTSKLPGCFEDVTVSTFDRNSSGQKQASMSAVADVPPLTADVVQLCHALLAVSNCAGLVAQAVVGFSVWWSLTLVPA
ncbi:unnamed protein product [Rhizoctonia solani]|uniref:Uncharacterized protein n=1 Tax=Rhizoctonia solani TaxID=456999 RepID=A0A8H3B0G7_9AGAM|nr:unnamed protein product [Rhizoctonia solani]